VLWADALCINQKDTEEKNAQVEQMKLVYESARQVLGWLGAEEEDSHQAMVALRNLGEGGLAHGALLYRREHSNMQTLPPKIIEWKRFCTETAHSLPDDFPMKAIRSLSLRPWWRRVWIAQEFSLGRDIIVMCGNDTINAATLSAVAVTFGMMFHELTKRELDMRNPDSWKAYFEHISYPPDATMSILIGLRRRYHLETTDRRDGLMDLLYRTQAVNSTLSSFQTDYPKDKIYGMLGIAADTDTLGITPKYQDSTSLSMAYTEAASQLLIHGNVDILLLCQFPKDLEDLPSWVPDWTSTIQQPCGGRKEEGNFRACGSTSIWIQQDAPGKSSDELLLGGIRLDDILDVGMQWLPTIKDYRFDWDNAPKIITDIDRLCAQSDELDEDIYTSTGVRKEARWRIPTADQIRDGMKTEVRASKSGADLKSCYEKMIACFGNRAAQSSEDQALRDYITTMGSMFKRRTFISTQGYVGLVPSHSQPGDIICVFFGVHVPLILRPLSLDKYELVGEAYVYGMMDGEILEKPRERRIFTIV
jgi:hypothetical protein